MDRRPTGPEGTLGGSVDLTNGSQLRASVSKTCDAAAGLATDSLNLAA